MRRILISALLFPIYLSVSIGDPKPINSNHLEKKAEWYAQEIKYEQFVKALTWVESRWNPNAIGTAMDYGLFQITPVRLADYNKRTGSNYTMQDMFNPVISRFIFDYYSKGLPFEIAARRWNRAYAWRDELGEKYWVLVKNKLNNLANESLRNEMW
jgi:hypothetical protein